ncbi:hypothetical protein FIBSPDRAFT_925123 [Athelia psychrophila]|uniref:Uncharacterized protein n=1 Tax=Athelia psychrophila TaxID=1759441 RepID=A0A166VEQ4_9AGAM|nr:hypothetical protein FIBSPDRAFT_925123 [Fibularhizoctonia sp. CBS 109695]
MSEYGSFAVRRRSSLLADDNTTTTTTRRRGITGRGHFRKARDSATGVAGLGTSPSSPTRFWTLNPAPTSNPQPTTPVHPQPTKTRGPNDRHVTPGTPLRAFAPAPSFAPSLLPTALPQPSTSTHAPSKRMGLCPRCYVKAARAASSQMRARVSLVGTDSPRALAPPPHHTRSYHSPRARSKRAGVSLGHIPALCRPSRVHTSVCARSCSTVPALPPAGPLPAPSSTPPRTLVICAGCSRQAATAQPPIDSVPFCIRVYLTTIHRFPRSRVRNASALAAPSRSPPTRLPPLHLLGPPALQTGHQKLLLSLTNALAGTLNAQALGRVPGMEVFGFLGGSYLYLLLLPFLSLSGFNLCYIVLYYMAPAPEEWGAGGQDRVCSKAKSGNGRDGCGGCSSSRQHSHIAITHFLTPPRVARAPRHPEHSSTAYGDRHFRFEATPDPREALQKTSTAFVPPALFGTVIFPAKVSHPGIPFPKGAAPAAGPGTNQPMMYHEYM